MRLRPLLFFVFCGTLLVGLFLPLGAEDEANPENAEKVSEADSIKMQDQADLAKQKSAGLALKFEFQVPKTFKVVRGIYFAFLPRYKKESIYNVNVTDDPAFEIMFLKSDAKTEASKNKFKFKTISRVKENYQEEDVGQIIDTSFIKKAPKAGKKELFRFKIPENKSDPKTQ